MFVKPIKRSKLAQYAKKKEVRLVMNEILRNLPMPIKTKRLILRPPSPGDGKELNAAVNESFTELHTWMDWAREKPTLEDSETYVRQAAADWMLKKELNLLILDREEKTIIGGSGFNALDWELPKCAIGYWVRTPFAGQGYITETVNALALYAFNEMRVVRLEITCDEDNVPSRKVAERLGFEQEAILKKAARKPNGELRNTVIYTRLNTAGLAVDGVSW